MDSEKYTMMESNLSVMPEGGAGKGPFKQGIKQFKHIVIEDGKNFTFNNKLLFAQIKPSAKFSILLHQTYEVTNSRIIKM
jgi:hypothetical protein